MESNFILLYIKKPSVYISMSLEKALNSVALGGSWCGLGHSSCGPTAQHRQNSLPSEAAKAVLLRKCRKHIIQERPPAVILAAGAARYL